MRILVYFIELIAALKNYLNNNDVMILTMAFINNRQKNLPILKENIQTSNKEMLLKL